MRHGPLDPQHDNNTMMRFSNIVVTIVEDNNNSLNDSEAPNTWNFGGAGPVVILLTT